MKDTAASSAQTRKKVVIIGAGFGGLNAAKRLGSMPSIDITVVDRHNYHLFQPLLYQVAMAGLNPGEIATPIRSVLAKDKHTNVLLGEVTAIDFKKQELHADFGTLNYDYLILACGSQHSYFGNEKWEPFAPPLKTLEQAGEIRRRVLSAFELAERESDTSRIAQLLTFVVVGGGPTGVELAGTLGEIVRDFIGREYRHISAQHARVLLVEAGPRVLASFDPSLSERAADDLKELGVDVHCGTRVTDIQDGQISFTRKDASGTESSTTLKTGAIIWGAGVKPAGINEKLGVPLDKAGRVIVEHDLSVPGFTNVFVIGDQACFIEKDKPLPGLAPVAIQQGHAVARIIAARLRGKRAASFRYLDKGQLATIGLRKAVLQMGKIKMSGFIAWCAWIVVHIFYLIGFKNRILVLTQWAWSYLTRRRGDQLILNLDWRALGFTVETGAEGDAAKANPPNH